MTNHNSTQAEYASNQFSGLPIYMLVALIDEKANAVIDTINQIECVAQFGVAYANSATIEDDPQDAVLSGICSTIIDTTSDMSSFNDLRDAIAELRRILVAPTASAQI